MEQASNSNYSPRTPKAVIDSSAPTSPETTEIPETPDTSTLSEQLDDALTELEATKNLSIASSPPHMETEEESHDNTPLLRPGSLDYLTDYEDSNENTSTNGHVSGDATVTAPSQAGSCATSSHTFAQTGPIFATRGPSILGLETPATNDSHATLSPYSQSASVSTSGFGSFNSIFDVNSPWSRSQLLGSGAQTPLAGDLLGQAPSVNHVHPLGYPYHLPTNNFAGPAAPGSATSHSSFYTDQEYLRRAMYNCSQSLPSSSAAQSPATPTVVIPNASPVKRHLCEIQCVFKTGDGSESDSEVDERSGHARKKRKTFHKSILISTNTPELLTGRSWQAQRTSDGGVVFCTKPSSSNDSERLADTTGVYGARDQ
ncbi:hypothetical protein CVT24_010507 [Panaeolus cyanescens]|uniref:Uncharacterized protein n=1 Tax=Panaeolus cyanescens TaxID=181874 RepID=A0A409YN47_9AGAR|nr:hypothetical protein CVT24_010507 [Panaeolus cyanescens]